MTLDRRRIGGARIAAALLLAAFSQLGPAASVAAQASAELPSREEILRSIRGRLAGIPGWKARWREVHSVPIGEAPNRLRLETETRMIVFGDSIRLERDGETLDAAGKRAAPYKSASVLHKGVLRQLDATTKHGSVMEGADSLGAMGGRGEYPYRYAFSADFMADGRVAPLRRDIFEGIPCVVVGVPTARVRTIGQTECFLDPARGYLPLAEVRRGHELDDSQPVAEFAIEYAADAKGRQLPRKFRTRGLIAAEGSTPKTAETEMLEIEVLEEPPPAGTFELIFPKGTKGYERGAEVVLPEDAPDFSRGVPVAISSR